MSGPIRVFASSMEFFQQSQSFDLFSQSNILHFFKSPCRKFPRFLSISLSLFLSCWLLISNNSIHMANPFQSIYSYKRYQVQVSNMLSNSVIYIFLQMLPTLVAPKNLSFNTSQTLCYIRIFYPSLRTLYKNGIFAFLECHFSF